MKNKLKHLAIATAALGTLVPSAFAQTSLLTYNSGDLFLGFRQSTAANSFAVNLGSAAQFLPLSLGGTNSPGSSFNVQFGVVPGSSTPVFNLNTDLTTVFGASWANNPTNGTGVRWAVVGFTDDSLNDTPISGLNARSAFLTRARTNPGIQSTPASYSDGQLDLFANEFVPFAYGTGAGAFANQNSTTNSSEALIGNATLANNWNQRIGANGSFGLGLARRVEQGVSGNFTGPTDSVLDLYLAPYSGSSLVGGTTYLGNFSLNNSGELTFNSVPEPSTYALLGLTAAAGLAWRMRQRRLRAGRTDA